MKSKRKTRNNSTSRQVGVSCFVGQKGAKFKDQC